MTLESGDPVAVARCPRCQSERVWKDRLRKEEEVEPAKRYICQDCGLRFYDSPELNVELNVTGKYFEGPHMDQDLPYDVIARPDPPLKKTHNDLHNKMRMILKGFGLGQWNVRWLPDSSKRTRGKADPETLSIEVYDIDEVEAWDTFIHEIVEIKMRSALRPYRVLVNKLIEGYQEIADNEKDLFIESLMEFFDAVHKSPQSS